MVKWLEQGLAPYGITNEDVLAKAGTNSPLDGIGGTIASADHGTGTYARLKIGYSAGVGNVEVDVTRTPWAESGLTGSVPYVTVTDLPDGSHLVVQNPADPAEPELKLLHVAWYRSDGTRVDIVEANVPLEKGATPAWPMAGIHDSRADQRWFLRARGWSRDGNGCPRPPSERGCEPPVGEFAQPAAVGDLRQLRAQRLQLAP
ncbi:hypothetical protein [Catenulispora pinisilvae]|uniref:hypothetical protein n=1 Tax=Catenulispora pinisilvae TaxID=2705253 RepID=UPI001890EBC0|nr:hypothetical protein [Catenulispora pinisilvae]